MGSGWANSTYTFGLDDHHRLVKADKGVVKSFGVKFQACPSLGSYNLSANQFKGRLLLETSDFVGENTCLTIYNPTAGAPYYAKAQKCQSGVTPPLTQVWSYGIASSTHIAWAGQNGCTGGYWRHKDTFAPRIASGSHLINIACAGNRDNDI